LPVSCLRTAKATRRSPAGYCASRPLAPLPLLPSRARGAPSARGPKSPSAKFTSARIRSHAVRGGAAAAPGATTGSAGRPGARRRREQRVVGAAEALQRELAHGASFVGDGGVVGHEMLVTPGDAVPIDLVAAPGSAVRRRGAARS